MRLMKKILLMIMNVEEKEVCVALLYSMTVLSFLILLALSS